MHELTPSSPARGATVEVIIRHPRPATWAEIKAHTRHRWTLPFHALEWAGSWGAHLLSSWSFVSVLEYLGTLSLILVAASYFIEASARVEQKHYQAWQVINTAQGKGGSGGRIEALQNLNDDKVPLVGVELSKAFLQHIRLAHGDLRRSAMEAADLLGSTLTGANLEFAVLTSSNFRYADLSQATLTDADFTDADLMESNLTGANVKNTDFTKADLRGADLRDLNHFKDIAAIRLANILGVKNAPEGFKTWALANGAVEIKDDGAWNQKIRQAAVTQPSAP